MDSKRLQPAPVFRHWPVLYAVIAVGLLFSYGLLVLVQRAVSGSLEATSAVLGGLTVLATLCGLLNMGWDMARAHSTFWITPTHLVVTVWPGFRRHELSWAAVKCAQRLRKPWWARGGEAEVAAILTSEGVEFRFMPHLLRDLPRFLKELRVHGIKVQLGEING
jgi:hypothetical protein